MHVWLTIPSLSKRGGGPAAVVQNLSEQLASAGVSVSVLTTQAEPGCPEALPRDPCVNVVHLPATGGYSGIQAALGTRLQTRLQGLLQSKEDSAVHDFGLWQPANHQVVLASRAIRIPLACSTCGMLAPWALRHKAWKKRLGWWLYQRRDLSRAALLVATSQQEVEDTRLRVPGKPIALVPNGVEVPAAPAKASRREAESSRKVVFLGRIHPVKGLRNLVEAWNSVRPTGWRCILAGPDEAGHQAELEALLRQRNLASAFEFSGMMENGAKWALLSDADLFVLPSFTENFGISVAEALACGVPAITTKGTPWRELSENRCGWWVDTGVEPLAQALREGTTLSNTERAEMGLRGRRLVELKYSWPEIARNMCSVYAWMLGKGTKPECVV